MPFDDRITNGMTPHRVFALCKLVHFLQFEEKVEISRGLLENYLQPSSINDKKTQFKEVFSFAKNGGLVTENNSDGKITTSLSKENISSSENFRRIVINRSINQKDLMFWRFTSWYLMRDSKVLSEKPKDLVVSFNQEINADRSLTFIYNDTNITGWRTWAVFLGYGYEHAGIVIPNLTIRLKDLLLETKNQCKRDTHIPFATFVNWLNRVAPELDGGDLSKLNRGNSELKSQQLSLGLSSGLRALYDQGLVQLRYVQDARDTWYLTKASYHEIPEKVSEILIRSEW